MKYWEYKRNRGAPVPTNALNRALDTVLFRKKKEKIGKFNLLEDNEPCDLSCDCGWNIQIGGYGRKDYKRLKALLKLKKWEE